SAALLLQWGNRVTPINISDAELPPCDKTGIELVKRAVDYFCKP
ncbi:MAG: 3-oxoacyl-ACP synthase, partial [Shewanella sp.]